MDKTLKSILVILVALVIFSSFSAGWFFLAKEKIYNNYVNLESLFKTTVEKLNRQLAVSNKRNLELKSKLEIVDRELKHLEYRSKDLTYKNEELLQEKDDLKKELARVKKGKVYLDKKLKNIESDEFVAELLKEKATLEVELAKTKEGLEPKEEEIGSLKRENMELGIKISRLENESDLLQKKLRSSGEVQEALSRDLMREKDRLRAEVLDREDMLSKSNMMASKLRESESIIQKANSIIKENEDMKIEVARLKKELDSNDSVSKKLLASREQELNDISAKLEALSNAKVENQIMLTALEKTIENKDLELARLQNAVSSRKDDAIELKDANERINNLLAEREDMRMRMFALEKDLQQKDNVRSSLVKTKNKEMEYFQNKIDTLLKEKEELNLKVASLEGDLQNKDRLRRRVLEAKTQEKQEIAEKYASLLKEREDYKIRLAKLENDLKSKGEEINNTKIALKKSAESPPYRAEAYHSLKEVDLPPIIMQREGSMDTRPMASPLEKMNKNSVGKGVIVTVNRENKFVVIDLGQDNKVNVGDRFNVLRNNKSIGLIEVIQSRKKIAACDIKDEAKGFEFQVGDKIKKR